MKPEPIEVKQINQSKQVLSLNHNDSVTNGGGYLKRS